MATLRFAVATALVCGLAVSAPSPVAQAAEGELFFGAQWWDQSFPDAKYQEFSQVPRGTFLQSYLLREYSGRNSVSLWGANAIRTDQATKFTWANGVRWRADFGYSKIPHNFSQVARWGWAQIAPGVFTIPDSLQRRNEETGNLFVTLPPGFTRAQADSLKAAWYRQRMTDFLGSAPPIDLGFGTRISTVRLRARPARAWQFEVRGTNRDRSGNKPYALDFGFNTALENPEPIDQRMLDADAVASYQRDRLSAQASAGLSRFDNSISTLIVDNPKRLNDRIGGDGPKAGQLDLYPDNQVVRGSMAIAYLMPKRTAIAATLSLSQGKQDDPFLPFTINTLVDTLDNGTRANSDKTSLDSLPARSLNGKSRQLNGDVRLTTSPVEGLEGALRFHYTDYDNQTKELNFIGQSPYDVSWQRYLEQHNHIFSNKQWQAGLDLDYAVQPQIKLGAIAEYRVRDRSSREVEKDNETVLGGRARLRPADGLEVTGKYTHGNRKLDKFLEEEYDGLKQRLATNVEPGLFDSLGFIEQPGLRRFDVADRVQDNATAGIGYMYGDRVELSANYAFLRNDFKGDTTLGLKEDKQQTILGSATFHVSDKLEINGGCSFGTARSNQVSRASSYSAYKTNTDSTRRNTGTNMFVADSNWTANLKDTEHYLFAGIDWEPVQKLSVSLDYQFSRTRSKFDLANHTDTLDATHPTGKDNALDLPDTRYSRHEMVLSASWRWLEKTTIVGRWGWEEYDIDDWAVNDVPLIFPVTGTSNAIFLGDSSKSYRAHRLALLVRHTF
jgi:MtrB/PioB family decaheme-associated outer membrane protein